MSEIKKLIELIKKKNHNKKLETVIYNEKYLERKLLFLYSLFHDWNLIEKVIKYVPRIITFNEKTLKQRYDFYLVELGQKCLYDNPSLLELPPETYYNKLWWLKSFFSISTEEARNILKQVPKLLTRNEKSLEEKVKTLAECLDIDIEVVKRAILRYPRLLLYSTERIKCVCEKEGISFLTKPYIISKYKCK